MSTLFQELCNLLQTTKINSTSFNPKIDGKVETFHAGPTQTMCHYLNIYGNNWDDFVDKALMLLALFDTQSRSLDLTICPTIGKRGCHLRTICPHESRRTELNPRRDIPFRIILVCLPKVNFAKREVDGAEAVRKRAPTSRGRWGHGGRRARVGQLYQPDFPRSLR
jgi:hypothetical protein